MTASGSPHRVDVLGCPFDRISFDDTVETVRAAVRERRRLQVVPGNVDFVMKARRDPVFCERLTSADLIVADGVPVVWAASLLGDPIAGRVSGTDLVSECARLSGEDQFTVAFVGAAPGIAAKAAEKLRVRYPRASIAVIDTPERLTDSSSQDVALEVRRADARVVLVALGAPRQEEWVQEYLDRTGATVGIGIGSAFDILSGAQPRAPGWMRDHGLEWFHRMLQDPSRLGRRYILDDSPFLYHLAREVIRTKVKLRGA